MTIFIYRPYRCYITIHNGFAVNYLTKINSPAPNTVTRSKYRIPHVSSSETADPALPNNLRGPNHPANPLQSTPPRRFKVSNAPKEP